MPPGLTLGKEFFNFLKFFAEYQPVWHSVKRVFLKKIKKSLPSASRPDARQRGSFAECHFLTLGKLYFFSLLTSKLFLQSSYNTWYSMFQCDTFLRLFLYFFNLFHLIEFSWIIQIITASHSNNKK